MPKLISKEEREFVERLWADRPTKAAVRENRHIPPPPPKVSGARRRRQRVRLIDIVWQEEFARLAHSVQDRCYYCGCETWLPWGRDGRTFNAMPIGTKEEVLARKAFGWRKATREHLIRRCDGGSDDPCNIALACAYCNSHRGDAKPEIWAIVMAAMVNVGRHPSSTGVARAERVLRLLEAAGVEASVREG